MLHHGVIREDVSTEDEVQEVIISFTGDVRL